MRLRQGREVVYDLVFEIDPLDQLEKQHIDFVLRWIESGSEIYRLVSPATPDVHLVCYFLVFDPEIGQILLAAHKKSGLWLPPGGHVEPGEHPMATVQREAKEELGMEAGFLMEDPFFLTVATTVGDYAHTDVSLWYLVKGRKADMYDYDVREFEHIQWFKPDEIPYASSDPHMKRAVYKLACIFRQGHL